MNAVLESIHDLLIEKGWDSTYEEAIDDEVDELWIWIFAMRRRVVIKHCDGHIVIQRYDEDHRADWHAWVPESFELANPASTDRLLHLLDEFFS